MTISKVTTEQMQDIYDAAVRVEFNEKQGESEDATFDFLCVMGADLAEVSATVRKLIDMIRARDAELLAVREAAPYGYLREHNGQVQISIGPIRPADRASAYATPWGAIYAAPPAPAVPGELLDAMAEVIRISDRDHEAWERAKVAISACLPDGENCWSCGKYFTYAQHSECDGYCPHCNAPVDLDDEDQPSPSVPDKMTSALAMTKYGIKRSNYTQWVKGWNACRAAMLENTPEAASQLTPSVDNGNMQNTAAGFKLVPAEPTEEGIVKAWREAGGKCDHETIKRMYAAMAAAPTPTK